MKMYKVFERYFRIKLKVFVPIVILLSAANAFSQIWGDSPEMMKRGQRIVGIQNLIGETESTSRQCIPAGKFIGIIVKRNPNRQRTMISNFVIRREPNQRITIYLRETLIQQLDDQQRRLLKRLLNTKRKIEVGMNSCRAIDGSLSFAASIEEL